MYLRKPDNAGSEFYCHKMRHASTLLALVDSNYKFLYADFGAFGSNHDAYVFNSSSLCDELELGIWDSILVFTNTLHTKLVGLFMLTQRAFGETVVSHSNFV